MNQFKVSRNTAQKAIELLVHEGMVVREQGKGSFVAHPRIAWGLQHLISFSEETKKKGLTPSSRILSFSKEHPSLNVAENLMVSEDALVFKLERLRLADDYPVSYQVSCIPETLCPHLDHYDFSIQSLYEVLENRYHLVLAWQDLLIKPILASVPVAEMLRILPNTPLLFTKSVTFLEDGTPIESVDNIYLSERYEFTVHSSRIIPHIMRRELIER